MPVHKHRNPVRPKEGRRGFVDQERVDQGRPVQVTVLSGPCLNVPAT